MDYLRGHATWQVRALKELLSGEVIVGTAPIILQGADSAERFETWRKYFADLFCYVPIDPVESHIAAARLCQHCRKAGKTPRSSNDCLIAQIAIENGLPLLHNDRDFNAIASVIGQLRIYS